MTSERIRQAYDLFRLLTVRPCLNPDPRFVEMTDRVLRARQRELR